MGGKGSGGRRVNAGRPRQSEEKGQLTGSRRARSRVVANQNTGNQTSGNQNAGNQNTTPPPTTPPEPEVQIPQPPGSLSIDELIEWNELAPLAARTGELTEEKKWSLVDLCRDRVRLTQLHRDVDKYGTLVTGPNGNLVANPSLTRYTTLRQRVDAGMLRFQLAPMGRALPATPPKPEDDGFGEFDDPAPPGGRPH